MHLALLALIVFGFARAPRFDDAAESIPVETISATQLNEIMEGEKTAKPAPAPRKAAPPPAEKPVPQPPTPPQPPAPPPPEPPPRPEPPKPEPPKPDPPKPQPPKPEPPKPQAEEAPSPPTRPREAPEPPERPRPQKTEPAEKPDKFKPDEIAKSLARDKPQDKPRHNAQSYDSAAIAKMLNQTKTAAADPAQGLANHHAARMSVSMEDALNSWFRDSYKNCWNLPPSNPAGENYVFDVRVTFNADGSLASRPVMINPPHDPEWRAHADSVMRAVMRCNPLHVPAQYAPYFDQWRSKIVHFDPSSAEG